ncbi:hypothetical protein AAFM79_16020 [Trichormus azollae HNT15244]
MKSERTRVSNNIIRSCLSLAFLPVVALLVPIGQDFYTHPAHAAIEINTNSLTLNTKSFVNPRLINTLQGHTSTVKSLNFSPNSKLLVSGGSEKEGMIRFWNPQTRKKLGTINRAHQASVDSILISPDGKTLTSCRSDYKINLWNLKTLEFSRSFVVHNSSVLSLAVSSE